MPDPAARSPKAEQTRQSIAASAMRLFRTKGYDKTTMRAIASEAGVSLGNAYYYFGSKEHLIQAFYDQMQAEHAEAASVVLDRTTAFAPRLEGVLLAWLDVAEPNHEFAGQFFKNAADPASPLSPFSPDSAPARDASIGLFRTLVDGSDAKVAPALRGQLPDLLWLLQMGIVLFWVYDASEDQQRSRMLVKRVVPIVDRLVRLSRLPVVRGVVDDVVSLTRELRS
ncbi:TetR/AcrR family transcriptional regulator [Nocardioides mangrovi]|uniref:TetR family transcriptional regulator n=1 Tax=Nocardioides mangrovi TaxID=2874580 RepID=A0ABS7UE40_9ACTN|nr:TetR family transcriptional regulator [Nocardioides mangrovi]MBZ5739268.1 TetR family transcriptional regulator [Nocardioides mangrovi]